MAVKGGRGAVYGVDYRGIPVYAALRSVPARVGFWWRRSMRQRRPSAMPPAHVAVGSTALSLILTAGALLLFIWRRVQLAQYRVQYEVETAHRRLAEQYNKISRMANDVILLADADGIILDANDRVSSVYGMRLQSCREPTSISCVRRRRRGLRRPMEGSPPSRLAGFRDNTPAT